LKWHFRAGPTHEIQTGLFPSTQGGRQPDTAGGSFRLTFETKIAGPIALGWGARFALGLFMAS
jgi:hypothetical protein